MSEPRLKLVKEKDKFTAPSRRYKLKNALSLTRMGLDNLSFLALLPVKLRHLPAHFQPHDLDPGFFGINVAPGATVEVEDYVFERLRELRVRAVRMDDGYRIDPARTTRFLDRLLEEGYDVLLHLVQPTEEAARMTEPSFQRKWADYLRKRLAPYQGRIREIEIGSTPNRHSWSGYTIRDYAAAAAVGQSVAREYGFRLIGPNISDFAPYFTVGVLAECARRKVQFDVCSDNLFVDRAGAPEDPDSHVLGRPMQRILGMDLVRKQRVLHFVAGQFGIPEAYCTSTYWTLNLSGRHRPRYVTEEQYAACMLRYYLLTAAAGLFRRVYWGSMLGYYKGLIDDGVRMRTYPPDVHHRYLFLGDPVKFRARPAFDAFREMVSHLSGACFEGIEREGERYRLRFVTQGRRLSVEWSYKPGNRREGVAPTGIDETEIPVFKWE